MSPKKIFSKLCLGLCFGLLLEACGGKQSNNVPFETTKSSSEMAVVDSAAVAFDVNSPATDPKEYIGSSVTVENGKDSSRKFIRTADLKFRVKSVLKSTYNIEEITIRNGGFVTKSNLTSETNSVRYTTLSADSSLESTYYTVINLLTLRVPNTKLDTTLKEIAQNIEYLDYRNLNAEDVALQLLSNSLTQNRSVKAEDQLQSNSKKTDAQALLLQQRANADEAKIANLSLKDQIAFSTIEINIYQREAKKHEVVENEKNIEDYKPSFGASILDAISSGGSVLKVLIITIFKLWPIWLLAFSGYFMYKKYRKNKNNHKNG